MKTIGSRPACALALFILVVCPVSAEDTAPSPLGEELTLDMAIRRALAESPRLAVFPWGLRMAEARVFDAGRLPNPELDLEIEDIRWSPGPSATTTTWGLSGALGQTPALGWSRARDGGARSGFSEAELTLSLSQVIELGGKRAKRVTVAEREREITRWDYEAARAEVLEEAARSFIGLLLAQERLALQDELLRVAEEVHRSFALRVKAGQASPLEGSRATVSAANTRAARGRALREVVVARARLAAAMGAKDDSFGRPVGALEDTVAVPVMAELIAEVEGNPDVARWASELALRDARFALAKAGRVPDPTLTLGYRSRRLVDGRADRVGLGSGWDASLSRSTTRFDDERAESLILGFSIPLPIFDRRKGDIAAAEYEIAQAAEKRRAAEVLILADLAAAREACAAARNEKAILEDEVLAVAHEIFEKTRRGYEEGKFNYLQVLDAQAALFDARIAYLDALGRYHEGAIRIERLTGRSLKRWAQHMPLVDEEFDDED